MIKTSIEEKASSSSSSSSWMIQNVIPPRHRSTQWLETWFAVRVELSQKATTSSSPFDAALIRNHKFHSSLLVYDDDGLNFFQLISLF
jgi:hypothetical protein